MERLDQETWLKHLNERLNQETWLRDLTERYGDRETWLKRLDQEIWWRNCFKREIKCWNLQWQQFYEIESWNCKHSMVSLSHAMVIFTTSCPRQPFVSPIHKHPIKQIEKKQNQIYLQKYFWCYSHIMISWYINEIYHFKMIIYKEIKCSI